MSGPSQNPLPFGSNKPSGPSPAFPGMSSSAAGGAPKPAFGSLGQFNKPSGGASAFGLGAQKPLGATPTAFGKPPTTNPPTAAPAPSFTAPSLNTPAANQPAQTAPATTAAPTTATNTTTEAAAEPAAPDPTKLTNIFKWGVDIGPGKAFVPPDNSLTFQFKPESVEDNLSGTKKTYKNCHIGAVLRYTYFSPEELRFFDYITQKVIDPPVYPAPVEVSTAAKPGAGLQGQATTPGIGEQNKLGTSTLGGLSNQQKQANYKWDRIEFPQLEKSEVLTAEKFFIPSAHILRPMSDVSDRYLASADKQNNKKKSHSHLYETQVTTETHDFTLSPPSPIKINASTMRCARPDKDSNKVLGSVIECRGGFFGTDRIRYYREGIGSVDFLNANDIPEFDYESHITIREGFVDVLTKKTSRGDIGPRLNRPAIITMYRIWPADAEGIRRRCSEDLALAYAEKVKQYLKENGYLFLDYKPSSGKLQFRVPNFDSAPIKIP